MTKKFRKPGKPGNPGKPGAPKQNSAPAATPSTQPNAPTPATASKQPVSPTGDGVDSNDPTIAKVQDAVREKIPPQFRVAVQRIVLAGMKVMFSPETHQLMLRALHSDTDPAHAVGMGVTQLMTLLYRESRGTMPTPAMVPAGILLCCEALDFMERSNMVQVTTDLIDNTVQTVTAYLLQKLGFTPEKMAQIAQRGQQQPQGAAPAAAAQPAPAPAQPSSGLIGQQMGAQS